MKILLSSTACFLALSVGLWAQEGGEQADKNKKSTPAAAVTPQVYVPDGQLVSSPVEVYVSEVALNLDQKPKLEAYTASNARDRVPVKLEPARIIPNATFMLNRKETKGTLLLFDFEQEVEPGVSAYEKISGTWITGLFTSGRFVPLVSWREGDLEKSAAGYVNGSVRSSVIVGNLWRAGPGMLAVVAFLLICLAVWSRRQSGSSFALLMSDGYASLAHFQLLLWTVAVVTFVGIFGIAKKELPDIPSSLIVLMGLSLVTTGSAYAALTREGKISIKDIAKSKLDEATTNHDELKNALVAAQAAKASAQAALEADPEEPNAKHQLATATASETETQRQLNAAADLKTQAAQSKAKVDAEYNQFKFSHLLSDIEGTPAVHVMSVAKAQMFLWTIVSVLLFTSKSIMNGELWVVPWELVALMGISQASYLAPKYWSVTPKEAPKG